MSKDLFSFLILLGFSTLFTSIMTLAARFSLKKEEERQDFLEKKYASIPIPEWDEKDLKWLWKRYKEQNYHLEMEGYFCPYLVKRIEALEGKTNFLPPGQKMILKRSQ